MALIYHKYIQMGLRRQPVSVLLEYAGGSLHLVRGPSPARGRPNWNRTDPLAAPATSWGEIPLLPPLLKGEARGFVKFFTCHRRSNCPRVTHRLRKREYHSISGGHHRIES